jgi:hypothetical protein
VIASEEADSGFILYTHSNDVTTALFKLGFKPDNQYTHENITLFRYTLPNKDILKNPVLAKSVMESAMDLKHIIRRLAFPLYTVGDDTGVFQCTDATSDSYLGLSRDPVLLDEILQKSSNSGISISTITIANYQDLYDTLKGFQESGIKHVVRFLDATIVEKYKLETVLIAVSFMLEDTPHDPLSVVTATPTKD